MVGSWGHVGFQSTATGFPAGRTSSNDTLWTVYGGAATTIFGFKLAGGAGTENVGGLKRTYGNAGVGASYGPVNVSLSAGKVFDSTNYNANKPLLAVAGFDVGLMPGLVAGAEVAYFDNDFNGGVKNSGDDHGWTWLADLRLAF